jgi:DNA-binding transcriptional LysR family regulator
VPSELEVAPFYLDPLAVVVSRHHPLARAETITVDDLRGTGLWWPLENSPGEIRGFLHRYSDQFGIPITTDGLNLGIDHFLDAIRANPLRVALVGTEWPLPSRDGVKILTVTPIPRFLWWIVHRKDTRQPQLTRLLELIGELRRAESWADYHPDRDWLPDVDRAAL